MTQYRISNLLLLTVLVVGWMLVSTAAPVRTAIHFAPGDLVRLTQSEMLMFNGEDFAGGARGQEFTVLKSEPREGRVYVSFYKEDGGLIAVSLPASALEPVPPNGWNDLLRGVEAFRDQRYDHARRLLSRAAQDAQYRTLASGILSRVNGAGAAATAARAAGTPAARQACLTTLQGLRDTCEQLAQQDQVTLALALDHGTDRLGTHALGNAASVPPSKIDRENLASRSAIVTRAVAEWRQATALRRMIGAARVADQGLKAEPNRPELKAGQARLQKAISEADSHHDNANKMRQHGPKGVLHALTALEMGLKVCADHPKLLSLKKEMQSAFEERTSPPVTPLFLKAAGSDVSAKSLEEGRRLYTSRCTECHDLELLDSRSVSAWREIVSGMARRARIDGAQQARIVEYLAAAQRGLDSGE